MAISARKLIYDFERKFNALNTAQGKSIRIIDAVSIINEAAEILIENNIKLAEVDSRYRDNLRQLEIKNKKLSFSKANDKSVFAAYPKNLLKRLNHVVVAMNDCCKESKLIVPTIVQSDDLHIARKDPYRKPDFFYEQLLIDEAGDGIFIYHDNEMEIKEVYIDYYRKINPIQAPSLVNCNDNSYYNWKLDKITKDVDFDIDSTYLARKVVDVAVIIASRDTKNYDGFESQLKSIISLDQIT